MKFKKVLFYLLAGTLAGCVPVMSINPLYDNQTLAFDEKLLGMFEAKDVTWEFTRSQDPNVYQLIYTAESKDDPNVLKGIFEARLVNLDGRLFLDIFPKEAPWGDEDELNRLKWPIDSFFMIPVHTFVKVAISESQLKIWLTDDDKFDELIKADPNAVRYESVKGIPVLTSQTGQIQLFVLKYADDDRLFPNENIMTRKASGPVKDANQTKPAMPDANDRPVELKVKTQ